MHLVGVQRQVDVERVEPLSGLRADRRRASDRLSSRIPIDHDLILGDVVAAVAGLRVVRIAKPGLAVCRVGIRWGWRRRAGGALVLSGDDPCHPEWRGYDGDQDQRHDHREEIRDPMRPLHGCRRSRNRSRRHDWLPRRNWRWRNDGGGGAAMYGCDSCGGVHLGSTLDMRKRSEIAVQVPREECGRNPASLPCYLITHLARVTPAAFE